MKNHGRSAFMKKKILSVLVTIGIILVVSVNCVYAGSTDFTKVKIASSYNKQRYTAGLLKNRIFCSTLIINVGYYHFNH